MTAIPKILGIIGPKGGVGKSTISANLALALTRAGARVVAMDLDLGSSNLHVIFGIKSIPHTLDDFLLNKVPTLDAIVADTGVPGLQLIAGGNVPGIASLPYQRKVKLIRHLCKLPCDLLILDLAPGSTMNTVDFALLAWKSLFVTTPDIPSMMSLYSFIKTAVHRRLSLLFKQAGSEKLLELLEKAKDTELYPDLKTMEDFYLQARDIDPDLALKARRMLSRLDPLILVNRVRAEADLNAGKTIHNLMREYLSMEGGQIVSIREDPAVGKAAARLKPVLLDDPNSAFAADMGRVVRALGLGLGR